MAEIPTLTVPDVQPRATPAGPQRVATPEAAFGAASAGTALKQQGQAFQQGSEATLAYAKAFQDLNNKAAADTANSEFDAASRHAQTDWVLANPGAKGLTPDANGVVPVDKFAQDLTALRASIAQKHNLSPVANALYDEQSRRLAALVTGNVYEAAKTGQHAFWVASKKAGLETLQNMLGQRPTDLDFVNGVYTQIAQNIHEQQLLGEIADDPKAGALATLDAMSKGLRTVVSDLGVHDPMAAARLQKTYESKGWISPQDSELLDRTLHGPLVAQIAAQAGNQAFAAVPGGPLAGDIKAAIGGQESGRSATAPTSVAGAHGYYQITPPLFDRFARPGESINNPADAKAVGDRALDYFIQKYNGDDARVAVAWYSGEHNVAPPGSPTPWLRDARPKPGVPGPSTSQYVAQVLGRMGPGGFVKSENYFGAAPPEGGGSPIARIEANLPTIQAEAQTRADAAATEFGIDQSELRNAVEDHVRNRYSQAKFTYDQGQSAGVDTLLAQVDPKTQEPISDRNVLFSIPGMQEIYGNLTEQAKRSVDRQLAMNANAYSPARAANYQEALGLQGTDRVAFANEDLTTLDLRRADYADLVKRQIRERTALQTGATTETRRWLETALKVPSISLNLPTDSTSQKLYVGALTTELENWQAQNPGKTPGLNDYSAIAQRLAQAPFLGKPLYQTEGAERLTIPEDFRARVRSARAAQGLAMPTEAQMNQAYGAYIGSLAGAMIPR